MLDVCHDVSINYVVKGVYLRLEKGKARSLKDFPILFRIVYGVLKVDIIKVTKIISKIS